MKIKLKLISNRHLFSFFSWGGVSAKRQYFFGPRHRRRQCLGLHEIFNCSQMWFDRNFQISMKIKSPLIFFVGHLASPLHRSKSNLRAIVKLSGRRVTSKRRKGFVLSSNLTFTALSTETRTLEFWDFKGRASDECSANQMTKRWKICVYLATLYLINLNLLLFGLCSFDCVCVAIKHFTLPRACFA